MHTVCSGWDNKVVAGGMPGCIAGEWRAAIQSWFFDPQLGTHSASLAGIMPSRILTMTGAEPVVSYTRILASHDAVVCKSGNAALGAKQYDIPDTSLNGPMLLIVQVLCYPKAERPGSFL